MTTRFEYFAPLPIGGSILFEFANGAEYQGLSVAGTGPLKTRPVVIKSPGQTGETQVDVEIPARTISLVARSAYQSAADFWPKRRNLSRLLTVQPVLTQLTLGQLRIYRDDFPTLEIDCYPQDPHIPIPKGWGRVPIDVDFYCPSPYFKDLEDSTLNLTSEAGGIELLESPGFSLPESPGFEFEGNDVEQEVVNEGDVPTPIVARMYGEITTGRLENVTTGEVIEVTGDVPDTHYVEIGTAFGNKYIELVEIATGERTAIMDRLNLEMDDFWFLLPGANTVRFEADDNVSGRALLSWRQLYGGL